MRLAGSGQPAPGAVSDSSPTSYPYAGGPIGDIVLSPAFIIEERQIEQIVSVLGEVLPTLS